MSRILMHPWVLGALGFLLVLSYRPVALVFFGLGLTALAVGNIFHRAVPRAQEGAAIASIGLGFFAALGEVLRTGRILHTRGALIQLAGLLLILVGIAILLWR